MLRRVVLLVSLILLLINNQLVFAETTSFAARPDVQAFIKLMVKKHHFDQQQLTTLFNQVKLRPKVIQHINKPLEKEPWSLYQMLFVNEWRIKNGVVFWNKYESVLKEAEKTYGVPASIIVATIGIETKYGQKTGEYRVIDSLSNIAFSDLPRAKYFRSELEEFLLLTRSQHLDPLKVMGSYAGAIGQPQFMPSSYRAYAVNFSKSGSIDLMHDEIDVIGSVANYYHKHGWTRNEPVAVPALTIGDRYNYLVRKDKINKKQSLNDFARYGVVPKYEGLDDDLKAKVIPLYSRYKTEYWLGFHNFDVIKRYNASDLYAMAVFQLSNYITALKEKMNNG